jgi:putative oxygen-independent coproporphyrinogen III oxidase
MTHSFSTLPPLSLYIHIPWCVKKCPYCDFNSHTFESLPEKEYLHALIADLQYDLPYIQNREIISIFFGGGTPSVLSAEFYQTLLSYLRNHIKLSDTLEITLEANPNSSESEKFHGYLTAGINRLSIGVQSFQPSHLKTLGRAHSQEEAFQAIEMAKSAGFSQFNIDLMYGLPHQNIEEAMLDLKTALSFSPLHLSWYQLTIEPNTYFYRYPPKNIPLEDTIIEMEEIGYALLAKESLLRYEVSAYAKENSEARHNLNYWQFGDYLGIGAGAHSKITLLDTDQIIRFSKTRVPKDYFNAQKRLNIGSNDTTDTIIMNPFALTKEVIAPELRSGEFFMNALRLKNGFDIRLFKERTGLSLETIAPQLQSFLKQDLIEYHGDILKTTERGYALLNSLLSEISHT